MQSLLNMSHILKEQFPHTDNNNKIQIIEQTQSLSSPWPLEPNKFPKKFILSPLYIFYL